ncbi:hypothetical protein DV702_10905 [Sporosarcina sp. PTS2304]|uniref:DUF6440 family protein n=1 Tax=Sporosarcina sp. PTS2304 TaxID=2283194 RepID=UPI000E0DBBBC|nr:DUF6440 family protein [Sporosarcina sp. PTS2304]AXI00184.1 hypothetical protein DV702_10905 [Sporosarcina sp. PTS2304]
MDEKRFEVIEKQGKMTQFQVIRDNQTGVLYMSYAAGYGLAMTVMVDPDGKPLVDKNYRGPGYY